MYGKIKKVYVGYCGYQDAQIGFQFELGGKDWGVCVPAIGHWGTKRTKSCKWSEQDRINGLGRAFMEVKKLLDDANKRNITDLEGTPIEAIFENNVLKDWRVLTEVI